MWFEREAYVGAVLEGRGGIEGYLERRLELEPAPESAPPGSRPPAD
jgi:hypothetical protein